MKDHELLSDFGNQPVNPIKPEIVPISLVEEVSAGMAGYYNAVGQSPYPSVQTPQGYPANTPIKQTFTQPAAVVTPLMKEAAEAKVKSSTPTQVFSEPVQPVQEVTPAKQKFSYYKPVGNVPPGLKAANDCNNCSYFEGWSERGYCRKFDFPCAENYVCDEFEIRCEKESECYSEPEVVTEVVTEDNTEVAQQLSEPEVNESLQKLYDVYADLVTTFSDGELAGEVLELTASRFNDRSVYSDAFMKMHYQKQYKSKHSTLDAAYVTEVLE